MGDPLFDRFGRQFPAGTVLFKEGDVGKEMYVIHTGAIRLTKKIREVETSLAVLGAGEFFGEMAVLNDKPRVATAAVEADAKVLVIDPGTFEAMLRGNAEIAIRLIKKLAERLQEADKQIESLLYKDSNSRVAHWLMYLAEGRGERTAQGIKINANAYDIAQRLGLDERTAAEALDKMVAAKIVQYIPDALIILNMQMLRKYLDYLEMKERFGE